MFKARQFSTTVTGDLEAACHIHHRVVWTDEDAPLDETDMPI